jgi:predicted metal-dependent phosphoesterase TrpH
MFMTGCCDLHAHSTFSDGTFTPAQLVAEAEKRNLTAVALTDHNTIAGLPDFLEAGKGSPVELVPGVEFSTEYEGIELHMLALWLEPKDFAPVTSLLEDFRVRKERSNERLVEALAKAGMVLDYEAVKAATGGYINRAHVAAALKDAGYVPTIQAAFEKILAPGGGFYNPPLPMTSLEAIRFIRSIGAVPVLAHPLFSVGEEFLRSFLPLAREAGLAGMEVRYSKYSAADTALAAKLAKEYGLLPSGGSDFHGANRPDVPLGLPPVPYTWMTALRK